MPSIFSSNQSFWICPWVLLIIYPFIFCFYSFFPLQNPDFPIQSDFNITDWFGFEQVTHFYGYVEVRMKHITLITEWMNLDVFFFSCMYMYTHSILKRLFKIVEPRFEDLLNSYICVV